jgi:thiamine kinase-like enzyme
MTAFGDWEPEDSWDRADDPLEQMENLRQRVLLLHLFQRHQPRVNTLDDLAAAVQAARDRQTLDARQTLRADQADEDIDYMRDRI